MLNVTVQIYRANQGKLAKPNAKVSLLEEPKSVSVEQRLFVRLLSQKRVGGTLFILLMLNVPQDHKQHTFNSLTYSEENKFPFCTPDGNYRCKSRAKSNNIYKSSILPICFRLYNWKSYQWHHNSWYMPTEVPPLGRSIWPTHCESQRKDVHHLNYITLPGDELGYLEAITPHMELMSEPRER